MNFLQKQRFNRQQILNNQDWAVINHNYRQEVQRRQSTYWPDWNYTFEAINIIKDR